MLRDKSWVCGGWWGGWEERLCFVIWYFIKEGLGRRSFQEVFFSLILVFNRFVMIEEIIIIGERGGV